jgi:hypothetical protein
VNGGAHRYVISASALGNSKAPTSIAVAAEMDPS